MSADPLSVQSLGEADYAAHLGNPQTWNKYAYVLGNPLNSVDPKGLDTYVVLYTTGNSEGQNEITRAAQTRANEISHQKGFDPSKDKVILQGVQTRADFVSALKAANAATQTSGPIAEASLFTHSGAEDPVFHEDSAKDDLNPHGGVQLSRREINSLPQLNWSNNASASFYGCRTSTFASEFAQAEHVTSYGSSDYMYFSANPNHFGPDSGGNLYERSFWLPHQIHGRINQAERMDQHNAHK